MTQLWCGTGDSLSAFIALEAKYFDQLQPVASNSFDEDEDERFDKLFGVDVYRPGLLHLEKIGNTAILSIQGGLVNGHQWWHEYVVGHLTSYEAIKDAVAILNQAADVSNVIVRIESPGGYVSGVDSASRALSSLKTNKNITVHSDTIAASAGYWLMSSLPNVYASPMAQIGNIGTLLLVPDYSEAYNKAGIKFHVFKAGKEKGYGLSETEFTEEEKASLQEYVEKSNNFFLTHVSRHRNLMISETDKWGEAQTFFAGEALSVGLIDGVATLEELVGRISASTNNGESDMVISQEKLAQISAGAAPETVLTQAELAAYEAQVQAEPEPVVDPEPEEQSEPSAKAEEPATQADLSLARELGKAEAKIEAMTAQIEALQADKESAKAQTEGLKVVAQAAVANLQTALQMPKEVKADAAAIVAQYNELTGKMAERFPVGQKSSAAKTQADEPKAKVPHPYRPH